MNNYYNNSPSAYNPVSQASKPFSVKLVNSFLQRVFATMSIGLIITGVTAFLASTNLALMQMIFTTPLKWVVMFAPLAFVLVMSFGLNRLSFSTLTILFGVFCALMGLSLSSIFLIFTGGSIALTFFVTAGTFGAMALIGLTTKMDLTKMGSILLMVLIGIVIASVVNMFLHSSTMDYIISGIGVIVFSGLTAYDVQNLSRMPYEEAGGEVTGKLSVMGALSLYLNFINLFLFLLRFLGSSRD